MLIRVFSYGCAAFDFFQPRDKQSFDLRINLGIFNFTKMQSNLQFLHKYEQIKTDKSAEEREKNGRKKGFSYFRVGSINFK